MDPKYLDKALNCFKPPVPMEARDQVIASLQEILDSYRNWGRKRIIFDPPRMFGETDEADEARCLANLDTPRKRGRPPFTAQHILLFELRALLGKQGCNYGVYKDGDPCSLVDLASILHLAAGMPRGDVDWQALANRYVDPLYEMELLFGDGFNYPKEKVKECRDMLRFAERQAYPKNPQE